MRQRHMGKTPRKLCWGGRRSDTTIPRFLSEIWYSRTRGEYRRRPPPAVWQARRIPFRKGTQDDISPVNKDVLISTIKKCHQTLWGGGKLSPPEAFGELCKIIFVKISDEQANRKNGEPYEFQIKTHESSGKLAERIRSIYEVQQRREPDVFTDTIKIDAATLRTIVSHIEGINLSKNRP